MNGSQQLLLSLPYIYMHVCVCACVYVSIIEKCSEIIVFEETSVFLLSVCEDISIKQKTTLTLIF